MMATLVLLYPVPCMIHKGELSDQFSLWYRVLYIADGSTSTVGRVAYVLTLYIFFYVVTES
jgi:hypothetical protein